MDPILILLLGLLGVLAIPGLLLICADLFGHTETHHRTRDHLRQHANREHPAVHSGSGR